MKIENCQNKFSEMGLASQIDKGMVQLFFYATHIKNWVRKKKQKFYK